MAKSQKSEKADTSANACNKISTFFRYGAAFKLLRKFWGQTQAELGNALRVSRETIAQIESCHRLPSERVWKRLSETQLNEGFFWKPSRQNFKIRDGKNDAYKLFLRNSGIKLRLWRNARKPGASLKRIRKAIGMTQTQFAMLLIETPASVESLFAARYKIGKVERGIQHLRDADAQKLSIETDVHVDCFFNCSLPLKTQSGDRYTLAAFATRQRTIVSALGKFVSGKTFTVVIPRKNYKIWRSIRAENKTKAMRYAEAVRGRFENFGDAEELRQQLSSAKSFLHRV